MTAIDRGVLQQLAADLSADDLLLVLRTFAGDMERLRAALGAAGQVADAAAWQRTAHGMAGAAAAVGATRVEQLARQAMAHVAIDPDTAARAMMAIGSAIDASLAELNELTATGTSEK
jgi:HPt (histidine-containing phosphotransfer) domain-containing protein